MFLWHYIGIEVEKRKINKKKVIIVIFIAIGIIALAVFGAMKLAENVVYRENIAKQGENTDNKGSLNNNEQEIKKAGTEQNVVNKENGNNVSGQQNQEIKGNLEQSGEQNPNNNGQEGQDPNSKNVKQGITGTLTKEQLSAIDNIYSSKEKRAFLTFDDGPSSSVTPKILETLKKENIKATFFVLGTMVKSNPQLLKREYDEGHYIANHGYSHIYKKIYKNNKTAFEEYNKTNTEIQKALGDNSYQSNVFRFPGGSIGGYYHDIKAETKKVFKKNNVAYLDWNALTNDSAGANTKEELMKNLKQTVKGKNSIVVLMHDSPNKDLTAKTLPDVIAYLKKQGYTFKNLYDIL